MDWADIDLESGITERNAEAFAERHLGEVVAECKQLGADIMSAPVNDVRFAIECREAKGWRAVVRYRDDAIEADGLLITAAVKELYEELVATTVAIRDEAARMDSEASR